MRGRGASFWWTTACPSPARTEPPASAARQDPGATALKVSSPIRDGSFKAPFIVTVMDTNNIDACTYVNGYVRVYTQRIYIDGVHTHRYVVHLVILTLELQSS
jgi:hypothetical protein